MSSKRHVRRKSCEGKIPYFDKESASRGAMETKRVKKIRDWFNVYYCKFCGKFHIGHPTSQQKAGMNRRRLMG